MADHIREAARCDAPLLVRLLHVAFAAQAERFGITPENWPHYASNITAERIAEKIDSGTRYFLLRASGPYGSVPDEPIGCVGMEPRLPEAVHVRHLAVLPAHRGKGRGGALVAHALAEGRRLGARRMTLGLLAADADLEGWYRRRGFEVTGKKPFEGVPFPITLMARDL